MIEELPSLPNLFLKIAPSIVTLHQSNFDNDAFGIVGVDIYDSVERKVTDFQNGLLSVEQYPVRLGTTVPIEVVERTPGKSYNDFSSGILEIYQNDESGTLTTITPTLETT